MKFSPFIWIWLGILVLLDIYFFQAVKTVTHGSGFRTRVIVHTLYWVLSAGVIIFVILMPYMHIERQSRFTRTTLFAIVAGLFFAKLLASCFFLIDDVRRAVQWIVMKLGSSKPPPVTGGDGEGITRSVFLSWAGMIAGSGLFGALIYGFGNKYRYQLKKMKLDFPNLPVAFKGTKIIHISDIHCGSFNDKQAVARGIEKIMKEKPDIILFTGDLVNNVADEMDDFIDVFKKLDAPLGVYSILGNHDYGDYVRWESPAHKRANLDKLKNVHKTLGWRLLMNEHVVLEKNEERIAIMGVENWSSKARFPKYGDLKRAHEGTADFPFKILLSHDPSHWKAEVCESYTDIDLVLSGHTHGMQFGVEIPGLKWSPVQYVYKEWAGLYQKGSQKLYVNRGFGFLGYPGRVGILPEITVLELS